MEVKVELNPESDESPVVMTISSYLLKCFQKELLSKLNSKIKGIVDIKVESSRVISIKGPITKSLLSDIEDILNEFRRNSIKSKLQTTEFIPLSGYSFDKLSEEVVAAVKEKRSLCLIKNYQDYLDQKFLTGDNFYIREFFPGTLEYSKVALMIYNKEVEELRNYKLEEEEW